MHDLNFRKIIILIISLFLISCKSRTNVENRKAAWAGSFYSENPQILKQNIDSLLARAKVNIEHLPRAIIVPHAGYIYSGETAAYSYKPYLKDAQKIKRVILLAPSHRVYFKGLIINEAHYDTPIGTYLIDKKAIEKLKKMKIPFITKNQVASTREHSDEVQIPFLLTVLPRAKLVPVIVGNLTSEMYEIAAKALSDIIDDTTIIVTSSDFTHYGENFSYTPKFKTSIKAGIKGLDDGAIKYITQGDFNNLEKYIKKTEATICGINPILLLLKIFENKKWYTRGVLLHYKTSGELTANWKNSVSYASISLGDFNMKQAMDEGKYVNNEEKKTLLKLSRFVLESLILKNESTFQEQQLKNFNLSTSLKKNHGVFVTLKKNSELRGCIGNVIGSSPIYRGVIDNTINAATRDPRFSRVSPGELKDLKIEISVMSTLTKIKSLDEIKVGRDGLVLQNGINSGLLLPQVPIEWGWNKTTYLENLSMKAGMTKDAYKHPNTTIFKFSAQVFGE